MRHARLHGVVLVVDERRVHVLLVVVPMSARLPQGARQDLRRLDLVVIVLGHHLVPVVDQRILQLGAVGKPEREARPLVGEHEQLHLLADLAVVALLGLFHHALVFGQLLLRREGDAVDAREHLVVLVALPVCARRGRQLEGFQRLGVEDVRAHAHVDVLALLVERDALVFG